MGCGMTKPTVSQPEPCTASTDNHHAPTEEVTAAGENQTEQPPVAEIVKEPDSTRSASPKSTDSGDKSTTVTDSEANEAQDYPIRITAKSESDTPAPTNPTATEVKKGFVAFDIPLNESQETMLDNVFKKPLPKRLRHLEPLGHAPQITTEMLMEKLEKAEEKRQKALARWKEQAARRREMAQRRSEQLGDSRMTNPGSRSQQSDDSESPFYKPAEYRVEAASSSKSKDTDISEQGSCSERGSAGSQLAGILRLTNELDYAPTPVSTNDASDQNNNSITAQRSKFESPRTDPFSPDNSWSSSSITSPYRPGRSYLQALQEERESITSEDDCNSEPLDQPWKSGSVNAASSIQDQMNNNARERLFFSRPLRPNRVRGI